MDFYDAPRALRGDLAQNNRPLARAFPREARRLHEPEGALTAELPGPVLGARGSAPAGATISRSPSPSKRVPRDAARLSPEPADAESTSRGGFTVLRSSKSRPRTSVEQYCTLSDISRLDQSKWPDGAVFKILKDALDKANGGKRNNFLLVV